MMQPERNPKDSKGKPGRQPRLLTSPEAAAYLRVSEWSISKLVKEGKVPRVSGGRGFLFDVRDLDDYIEAANSPEAAIQVLTTAGVASRWMRVSETILQRG